MLSRCLGQKSKPEVSSYSFFNVLCQTHFSSLLQNGLGFFSVVMCNFYCIPWKEYLKENMYKVLFCVLKQRRGYPSFWGICVGGCGRDPPQCSMLLVFLHYLYGVTLHPQTWWALSSIWGSARSHTPGGVAQALESPWWHWGAGAEHLGGSPLKERLL